MVNYSLGKIYKIEPISGGEEGDVYIGSSTLPLLSTRMANHRNDYKRWKEGKKNYMTSYDLFEKYGVENCHILLLENVNAANKDELFVRERHWITNTNCVNERIPCRTFKEYYVDNKQAITEKIKQYRDKNTKEFEAYQKQYQEQNKEVLLGYQKQYREKNRETLLQKQRENRRQKK